MELQLALDCAHLDTALKILEQVRPYIDIAELGTPLMYSEGARAIRTIKEYYPDLAVLSDMKLMDGGEEISSIAYEAGADIVTVLGVSSDATVSSVLRAANRYGRKVFADLINAPDIQRRAAQLEELGVHYIGVHTSYDLRETVAAPLEDLGRIQSVLTRSKTAISGGIKPSSVGTILPLHPDVIIVGSGIMGASDPLAAAKELSKAIHS